MKSWKQIDLLFQQDAKKTKQRKSPQSRQNIHCVMEMTEFVKDLTPYVPKRRDLSQISAFEF